MDFDEFNRNRNHLNKSMVETDEFFDQFGALDDKAYGKGAIPQKYKELTGLSISVLTRCEECVLYHIQGCIREGADRFEIVEAIKMGVIGGGSITYPTARLAFKALKELKVID